MTVVGARPQFVKAAVVGRAIRARCREILVHTGQHYDDNMSERFFRDLKIAPPDHQMHVRHASRGEQLGEMIAGLTILLRENRPDLLLVYGDTTSTVAGALAAASSDIPLAHVEAGLRCFNRSVPEEQNRIVTDHLATLLFCPHDAAAEQLNVEGVRQGVHVVGDVMLDALQLAVGRIDDPSEVLQRFGLSAGSYLLTTIHRAENTDDPERLRRILAALAVSREPVLFPVHPRTRKVLSTLSDLPAASLVRLCDPLGYFEMVALERSARMILTDSGGVQKEAYWLKVPCVTLRQETEWVETVDVGWNILVGAETDRIVDAIRCFAPAVEHPTLYGDGHAAERIAGALQSLDARPRNGDLE